MNNEKQNECELCKKYFTQKYSLNRHINAVHLKLKIFKCELCEQSFGQKGALTRHINDTHLKLKSFKCEFCEFACSQKGALKIHINTIHLKLKIFKCELCEQSFGRKNTLTQHVNNIHLKLKNFKCELCGFACSQKGDLKRHINDLHLNPKEKGMSRGEAKIFKYLTEQKISFEKEKTFKSLKGTKKNLRYDFFLPDYNRIIEYNGEQHFEYIDFLHGTIKKFELYLKYDQLKIEYANLNNINILIIKYDDIDWKKKINDFLL